MQKNVTGQKIRVFAFNETDNTAVTGDAANITIKASNDWGVLAALTDVNPTETEDGYYVFDVTQAESNYDNIDVYPDSSTANIQVIGVPGNIVPVAPNFSNLGIESDGDLTKVNLCATTTTNTDMVGTDGALLASSINLTAGAVDNVTTVATTTTNTDMRGTDGANTTTPPTVSAITADIDANSTQLAALIVGTGTDIPALIAALNDLSAGEVNAEVVDVMETDTHAEVTSPPAAISSYRDRQGWLFALSRNELNQTATGASLRNDADDATIATSTDSDDGTTGIRGKWS